MSSEAADLPLRAPSKLIPPAVLARLGSVELVARAVVDGVLHGTHLTDRPGFSQEFAEYRDYVPGDDLRFVDWNAYARTDRPFLKLFEGETNTRMLVLVDTSASMGVGDAQPTKLRYAAWLAASLVHLAGRQHDAAGLMTFADSVGTLVPPRSGAAARQVLFHLLDAMTARGGTTWSSPFGHAARRMTKRGIVAAVSDFYCSAEDFRSGLAMLGARGHDLIMFHVLDAAERRPRFGRNVTVRDAESGRVLEVDASDLQAGYSRRLASHEDTLRREAGRVGAHYVRLNVDEPLDRALTGYLRFRARRP